MQPEQPETTEIEQKPKTSKLGDDVAFGMQQTLVCVATDFIDPFVGGKIQKKWGVEIPEGKRSALNHAWFGELVGDFSAFFVFLGVQKFIPGFVPWLQKTINKLAPKIYEKAGKREIRGWAKEHHVAEGSKEYNEKLAEWKNIATSELAKSSVITVASTGANIVTQCARGNPNKFYIIAISKIAGALITMTSMLGLRYFLPRSTRQLDTELNEKYFSPLISKTQKVLGIQTNDEKKEEPKKLPQDITLTRVLADVVEQPKKPKQYTDTILQKREAESAAKTVNAL